jgi:hypothetical protein
MRKPRITLVSLDPGGSWYFYYFDILIALLSQLQPLVLVDNKAQLAARSHPSSDVFGANGNKMRF